MKAFKSYIDNNGRLAIPAKIRKKMHLNKELDDALNSMTSEDWKLWASKGIKQTRRTMKKYQDTLVVAFCLAVLLMGAIMFYFG